MPRIHADETGKILRFTSSPAQDAQYPEPPLGTASTLEFDATSNVDLVEDLSKSLDPYLLIGVELTKDGTLVVVNPDAPNGYQVAKQTLAEMPELILAAVSVDDLKPILTSQAEILSNMLDAVTLE